MTTPEPEAAARPGVLGRLLQDALRCVDDSLAGEPRQRGQSVDRCEVMIVAVRDHLIARLRQALPDEERQPLRPILDHINAALSLVVGVEYPSAGPQQQKLLEQARGLLAQANAISADRG